MRDTGFLFEPFEAMFQDYEPVPRRVRVISADDNHALVIALEDFARSRGNGGPPPQRGTVLRVWLDELTAVLA